MNVGYNIISAVTSGADSNWNGYLSSNEATVSGSVDNSYNDVSVSRATSAIANGSASIKDFRLDPSTAKSVAQRMANYDAWISKDDLYLSPAARSYVDGMAGGAVDNRISVSEMTAALERGGLALTSDGLYRDYEVGGYNPGPYVPAPPPVDPNPPYVPTPPSVDPNPPYNPAPPYVDPNPPYNPAPPYVDPNPPYNPAPPYVDPNPPYVPTPPSVDPNPPYDPAPPSVDPNPPYVPTPPSVDPNPPHVQAPPPVDPRPPVTQTKPAPKPAPKPTPKPVTKPAPKPAPKPTPKPVTKPAPKPTAKPPAKPTSVKTAPPKAASTKHENWFMRLIHAIF